ncbi:MAG: hypothetical protein ABEJ72_08870, partial [Candidatus Aenigmatarchaeota archaeon]
YSELLIRNYVRENGIKSLRNVSERLRKVNRKVEDPRKKAEIIEDIFGTMRPCYNYRKKAFDRCLEEIHEQRFKLKDLNIDVASQKEEERDINVTPD